MSASYRTRPALPHAQGIHELRKRAAQSLVARSHRQVGRARVRRPFSLSMAASHVSRLAWTASRLLPLNGCWWFARDVEYYAVELGDFVGNAGRDLGQHVVGNSGPVGCHCVIAGDGAQDDGVAVASAVSL